MSTCHCMTKHWEILWHFIGSVLITITMRNRTHTVLVSSPNLCTIAVTFGGAQWFLFLFKKTLKWQCGRPFFPPHTLKLVCVQQNPAKARCIHTKIHTDLNHKIIHSVLCFYDIYMNLATASSSSSQRENCSIYVVETGWTWFSSKGRKKYPFSYFFYFFVVTNLELKRTILHYFVTIFVTEDQSRWESLPLSPVSSKAISRYLWNRETEWRHLEMVFPFSSM